MQQAKKFRSGFTLVEVIVVLLILAILVALVVPHVSGYVGKAKETAAISNARLVMDAASLYATHENITTGSIASTATSNPLKDYIQNNEDKNSLSYQMTLTNGVVTSGTVSSNGIVVTLPDLNLQE